MWLTALFQIAIGLDAAILDRLGGVGMLYAWVLSAIAMALPAAVTGLLFTTTYHYLPNTQVRWRDATYGDLVAMLLFEIGKHGFFWISGLATQRSIVYGPVAAFVLLLMWAFVAGLIFLYGAALVKAAGQLRPTTR